MVTKKIYKIIGMDCASCAMLIEGELAEKGIKCTCSYPKQTLEVEFIPDKTQEKQINKTVSSLGYALSLTGLFKDAK